RLPFPQVEQLIAGTLRASRQFSFPRYQSSEQQTILQNLSDVIVQVHSTALYGGSTFEQAVEQTL
ncbi:hypothetical protein G7J39_004735, partial [Salmonella enterica subsp. enterica serovar 4,[5],12:i:-]|nr:hypothetical protein [Salmonella enterica subsp. enterica serovar Typhimurium]EEI8553175.1 hypothetical protein [Salmonella enterica subsp. enterica serovar 4,[5],12:i:-]